MLANVTNRVKSDMLVNVLLTLQHDMLVNVVQSQTAENLTCSDMLDTVCYANHKQLIC